MKILSPAIIVSMILFASSPAMADDDYVSFAKSLPAKKYDKNLPSIPTEQWLNSILPRGIVAVWGNNITDCGEQTGDPAIDRGRDMPLCAEIELKQKDKSVGYLLLFVGTEEKGKLKETAGLYYGYIKQGDKTIDLRKLQEITKLK
ncbi:MAG: hypothetical protein HZA11_08170 [Nitrospirae bacterium]|nr:hypothetical protein [Nitrospirota bacterium]